MNRQGSKRVEIRWVRTPHQDRSRRTLGRLLDAAETLLQERGFENVTVAEIAQAGASSVGAFYARFRDKNGLLNHLHERFSEEALATAQASLAPERWAKAGVCEIVTAITQFMEQQYRQRQGLLRAFLLHGCAEPQFLERERRVVAGVSERLSELFKTRDEIRHPDPAAAAAFGFRIVLSVLKDHYVLRGDAANVWPKPRGGLAGELARAYCAYLGLPDSTAERAGRPARQRRRAG